MARATENTHGLEYDRVVKAADNEIGGKGDGVGSVEFRDEPARQQKADGEASERGEALIGNGVNGFLAPDAELRWTEEIRRNGKGRALRLWRRGGGANLGHRCGRGNWNGSHRAQFPSPRSTAGTV